MRSIRLILITCICCYNVALSQQITVDNNIPVQDLIENNLADGCVEISNVTSSLNGSTDGFSSFGSFQRGNSNFPLSSGILLTTGNAASAGNTSNTTDLSDGTLGWGTDPDIETALGVSNTVNATVIEFDFIALSDNIQFNYLLASEEYYANYPCNSSDGFAFLIRESTSTGPYQNIALIPGTNTPVTVNNIHDEILTQCSAANDTYFDGYSFGDTNYNGRTTVLTAASNVTPNVQYHVKLIVADQGNDPSYDTAVFIEANTFTELELGDAISSCTGNVILNGEIQNPLATYSWYRDGGLISGETNPTINASLSGLYRVDIDINGVSCTISDEVNVTIDSELTTNPIAPYLLCDDNGDGEEIFDLSTKDQDVINAIPNLPANYTIAYYYTDADARNDSGNITSPIPSGSRTIYVRVEDSDQGCVIYGTIALEVNNPPTITQQVTWDVCDNDNVPDNSTQIDLREKDNEFTNSQANLNVSYHYTPLDAANGNSPIPPPYVNSNANETLYVRVLNTMTGCIATGSLDLNITNGNTGIIRDTQYIDACDADHDGTSNFNLTEVINTILNGETGFLPPTYHTSQSDAESGTNPISNPTNYQNTNPEEQTIYVRLEDSTTGCYAIIPIEIHTNLLLTATNIPELGFAFCDDDNDGSVDVYLNPLESVIANGLPNVTVTFYHTENNRDNNIGAIDTSSPLTISNDVILYINLENGSCSEVSEVLLRINPVVTFPNTEPINYCDNDDDGFTTIDFDSLDPQITGGVPGFSVRYFLDPNDADSGTNQLPRYYDSASNTFYARIENTTTNCYTVNEFEVNVVPAPTVNQPSNIVICNNTGTATISLDDKISEVVSDPTGLSIDFYESYDDALNNVGALDEQSYNTVSRTIYVRVQTIAPPGCFNIVSFDVVINTIPVIPNIVPYQICVDEGVTSTNFILADKDGEILNGQSGKEVFYYEDAAFANPIDKHSPYASSGAQTIYVRVENITDPDCNSTASFTLEIASNPDYNRDFDDFPPVCQTTAGNHTFNLEAKRQEIAQGSTDTLSIEFYLSENDAYNNTGTPLPDQYTSQALQGQFYVRIENTGNTCVVVEEVRFITFPTPHIISASIAPVCDSDYDGNTTIDLNNAVFDIENVRFSDVSISYYEDVDLITEIPTAQLTNYPISTSKTIYVKAEVDTGCFDSSTLDLQVNLPPTLLDINTVADCQTPNNTYDLSQVDTFLIHSSTNATISYHDSQANAENNTGTYTNKQFSYTSPGSYTIYARVEDAVTGCPAFTSFTLQINTNPIANRPPNLTECDDDFDGDFEFDLTQYEQTILGNQNPNNFSVYYYNTFDNAEADANRLDTLHEATNGDTIYVRVENNSSECYALTEFNTIVYPLPLIPINETEALCSRDVPRTLNADTGNQGDTYLWWNGATTSVISVDDNDLGTHWVSVTTPNGCIHTKNFTLIESEAATINFTTTVDFADPNSITVDVSGMGDYVYILDDGEPQTSNVFENVWLGLHTVTVRDLNGCNDVSKEVIVIDAPKFVTPNNDGAFDYWHIVGIEELPGTVIYIYDRYGKLLKTLPHTSVGWDGTFNGQNMPADDYWFFAKVKKDGEAFDLKGHFALKR
ncbi:T9SS type B sorting domain-containing protein [Snuella sedimenti]|uniref:T9SS type B sorting domain-containing protein n=1 Tax=Snuella sedimenti TaxID=2798802 RepID=A0A8J7IK95_9FLAO|nr:choice-of-anchor L domain-containing protein [Snuella sedimenti]MBJ6369721.1 T9SS type B sorting domain-containing protein [Snuella sedimenti]